MKIAEGIIEIEGVVKRIERSLIPGVVIITIVCDDITVKMDLMRKLLVFDEGDKVSITISRERPNYEEGKDFVAWGYVVSKKKTREVSNGNVRITSKLLISLWGYLVILESVKRDDFLNSFSYMDKVYMKIRRLS